MLHEHCGGPFCILGWTALAVLRPNNSGVEESGLVQLKLTLSQFMHKLGPLCRDLGHVPVAGDVVIKTLWHEKHNITR